MVKRFALSLFFLLFTASGGWAATYYVDSVNGNDSWTGLAGARVGETTTGPWRTLSKVNTAVSGSGDDVYLREGQTFPVPSGTSLGFHIDWSGTSGDRAIVGAYYLNESGDAVVGYTTTRPKVSGVGKTLPTGTGDSRYAITLSGDYITLQDIEVMESSRVGIRLHQDADNNIIQRCYIHHNYSMGISAYYADNLQILDNLVYYNVYDDVQDHYTGTGPDWGSAVGGRQLNGVIIRGNKIWNNWGESLGLFDTTNGFTIDKNLIFDGWGPLLYIDTGPHDGVISRNVLYRSQNTPLRWDSTASMNLPYGSIVIAVEGDQPYYASNASAGNFSDIDIWGNLVIGGKWGIMVSAANMTHPYTNVKVYNNTILEPFSNATVGRGVEFSNVSGCEFKNNIVWQTSGNASIQANLPATGVTKSNNAWSKSQAQLDDDAEGTGDVYSFAGVTKTTGLTYTAISPGSITGDEFVLPAGSAAIDAGVNLCPSGCASGLDYNTLIDATLSDLTVPTWATTTQSGTWDLGGILSSTITPPSGGWLAGNTFSTLATVNLTTEGTLDWHKYGYAAGETNTRKSGTQYISNWAAYGEDDPVQWAGNTNFPKYSWTDGTPTASATDNYSMMYRAGEGEGFTITIPALAGEARKARIYFGAYSCTGTLTASLGDSSAAAYTTTWDTGASTSVRNKGVELEFYGSEATTLTINIYVNTDLGDTGNVNLQAITLQSSEEGGSGGTSLPSGAVAAWPLAASLDDIIGSADLTATGTVSQAAGHSGTANTARSVASEANSNYLSASDSAVLSPTGSMAVSFWYKKTGAVTNDALNWIIGKGSTNRSWGFRYSTYGANDTLQWGVKNTTGTPSNYATYTFSSAMPTDTWVHIVAQFDSSSGTASVYVDGVKGTDYTYAYTSIYDNSESLFVFAYGSGLPSIPGVIDDIVLYHRTLTTAEITALGNLREDFATDAQDPVPVLNINSFGSGGYAVPLTDGEVTIPLVWSITGATPSECGVGVAGEGGSFTTVTCGDNAYDLVLDAVGLYDEITFRTKAAGGSYVYATIASPIYVRADPDEWIIASVGGDNLTDAWSANLGPASGTIFTVSDANVDFSEATFLTACGFTGTTSGTRTFTGGGQTITQWPTWGGPVVLGGSWGSLPALINKKDEWPE